MENSNIYIFEKREEFKKVIAAHNVVIVKVTATWCGPCKRIKPLITNLFNKIGSNVPMIIVDLDNNRDIASYLKVRSVPMLCNYVSNEPMDSVIGANEEKIAHFFKKTEIHASS